MQNKLQSQQKTGRPEEKPATSGTPKNSWEMSAQAALRVNYVTSAQYNTHEQRTPAGAKC